ncbi:MAG: CDP-alcohol phosphatidyltransferase family protein [Alphaproteobacteria bacterium]
MFDAALRPLIDPPLNRAARWLTALGLSANAITVAGFVIGAGAVMAVAAGLPLLGLALLVANRIADGLDGAVARQRGPTDLGGYLDIVFDFLVYSGLVFAFAVDDPNRAMAAAFLIFSFVGTGATFLAYAVFAAKRGRTTARQGAKSIYYLGGLTEGTETFAVLVLMCLWPAGFTILAWLFAALAWLTVLGRVAAAWRDLRDSG